MVSKVQIVFKPFGPIRRLLRKSTLELEVPEGCTVKFVIDEVLRIGGEELGRLILHKGELSGNLIVLVNRRDVRTLEDGLDVVMHEGDQVALLPHVQGG